MALSTTTRENQPTGRTQLIITSIAVLFAIGAVAYILSSMGIFRIFTTPAAPGSDTEIVKSEHFRFGPETLTVTAGQAVTLNLTNADMVSHSFDVDELALHVEMPVKETTMVTFMAIEPGEYQIYCSVPGHTEAGMVATLLVETP